MTRRLQLVLTIGFIIFFQHITNAQENQDLQFLSKVGILDSLYSHVLDESREIYIQLPTSYSPDINQKYPVIFILDGEVFMPTVSNVHDFYSGGFIPDMVLVGISNSQHRTRDLTSSTIKTKYGLPFNEENGKADKFLQFIEKELIPYIENKYPVTNYRTLIGHSYGGLFTLYTLLNHSQLFANYLSIDPSLDWDNQKLLKQAEIELAKNNFTGKSLYMSLSGQLHMQKPEITIDNVMQDSSDFTLFARSNIAFSELAKQNSKNGLSFQWKFYSEELHGTIPFPSIMDGLISLFKWFQMENTDKINSPDTPKEELLSIIKYRANKLQSHFRYPVPPYPEELLNMSGYMSLDMQQAEKAKMYFESAIKYYPKSANAYDSMADYYENQKDMKNALKFMDKAYKVSGKNYYKKRMAELKKRINRN